MLVTVKGVYKDGNVELTERPADVKEADVLVTFLPPTQGEGHSPASESELRLKGTETRQTVRERVFARMEQGRHLGGAPYPKREDLYDRPQRDC